MFVRRGMKDHRWFVFGEKCFHAAFVADISDARHGIGLGQNVDHFPVDVKEVVFGLLDQHQTSGLEGSDLAAEIDGVSLNSIQHFWVGARWKKVGSGRTIRYEPVFELSVDKLSVIR